MTQDTGISIHSVGGQWTLYAQNAARMSTPNLPELRAYIYGVWDGIKGCTGEYPDHTCPIYSEDGVLIDTLQPAGIKL